jgi:hypothetical protein
MPPFYPARAAKPGDVTSITIKDGFSRLTLTFDKPITQAEATDVTVSHSLASTASFKTLTCGTSGGYADSNGLFTYQYYCSGSTRTIPWGFSLSASNQATVVGLVNETGLRWWCNGAFVGQNAPHAVPPSYQFHGTMNPVAAGCMIDYQDYMTWRHNIGSGGTAALTLAGTFYLAN